MRHVDERRGNLSRRLAVPALAIAWLCVPTAHAADNDRDVAVIVDRELPGLVHFYEGLHAAPELSRMEARTSASLAEQLRESGYEVTERVGKYLATPTATGYGVVALFRNGAGPTLLVRADMDALPVEERTGLRYASTVRTKLASGTEVPVMHACGHDIHVSALVGFARVMAGLKERWHGTLMLVGQPAEETIDGANAMLKDDLYARFPRPSMALALHDYPTLPAGSVGLTPGYAMATSTQVDVLVRGVSGHGARPDEARDPVVLAANIIMQLQTIVSREISPFDQAVVTVGTIHGGTKRNIIPDEVKLEINLRAFKETVRQHLIEAVARIVRAAALGAGMPEDRLPLVTVIESEFAPALFNDPALVERLTPVLRRALGNDSVRDFPPLMASEDFGRFGLDQRIPVLMFWVGASTPESIATAARTGEPVPALHSSRFAPIAVPTLRTGILAMSAAALELLGQ